MLKQAIFKIKGMNRDLSASAFNPEYAYRNENIRVLATNENTQFSVTNEKGNKYSSIEGIGNIDGIPIGKAVLNNELILFVQGKSKGIPYYIHANMLEIPDILMQPTDIPTFNLSNKDKIYKLWLEKGILKGKILYQGNLNFDANHPIESITHYENEDVKKVYWVDGLNQPRFINISDSQDTSRYDNESFDFVKNLKLQEEVYITKNSITNGYFAPGVIQYALTYYNKYGQESGVFYTSPLYYISNTDRGNSPEDKVNNSFTINIKNSDTSFEYIRIYSIQRTSLDATPEVKLVTDLATSREDILYIDNGTRGSIEDPTSLFYKGGEDIVASTISQKDNTMFLGDLKLNKITFTDKEEQDIKNSLDVKFTYKEIPYVEPKGFYPYKSSLNDNSNNTKTFKGGETYRIAIQLQHKNGKYSNPIFLNDIKNDLYPQITDHGTIRLAEVICDTKLLSTLSFLSNFKNARLLMAKPTASDKTVICQGVLCPTLYNLNDRFNNAPFAISSWFMRFDSMDNKSDNFMQYRHNYPLPDNSYRNCEIQNTINPILPYVNLEEGLEEGDISVEFYINVILNISYTIIQYKFDVKRNGKIIHSNWKASYEDAKNLAKEYMDEKLIPDKKTWSDGTKESPVVVNLDNSSPLNPGVIKFVDDNGDNFYIDQSIVTFHSPDINDYDINIDSSTLKLRIVGIVQSTSVMSDYSITTSTSVREADNKGVITYSVDKDNLSTDANGIISAPLWQDSIENNKEFKTIFATYPWHRNGSLNDDDNTADTEGKVNRTAVLKNKIISNLRFSYYTKYFSKDKFWNNSTGITPITVFNSDQVTNARIPSPVNSGLGDINYYGNLDKIVNFNLSKNKKGYPIKCVGKLYNDSIYNSINSGYVNIGEGEDITYGQDPVSIRYKSTPHAVFAFNYTTDGSQVILPALNNKDAFSSYDNGESKKGILPWDESVKTLRKIDYIQAYSPENPKEGDVLWNTSNKMMFLYYNTGGGLIWLSYEDALKENFDDYKNWIYKDERYIIYKSQSSKSGYDIKKREDLVHQDIINTEDSEYPFVYIAELYRDTNEFPLYGGTSPSALQNNLWTPIGNNFKKGDILHGSDGDTYFQRWDCLKTYAFTKDDTNSVVDITSFMVETRNNIDGRYDRNRGQKNNTVMSPLNFNLINPIYTQSNNFFNYRILDNKFDLNEFPCSITWSRTKQEASDIDIWTNVNLSSILDLDGDKGPVRAIRRFNNNLIAFQDKGISQILYNENVQIQSTAGVPIELANSGKVQGKRYFSDKLGCTNKWSIAESPSGLFFIDDITKGIYLFNGQITNIAEKNGFHSWIGNKSKSTDLWNPIDFNNAVSYYDNLNSEVFFIYKDECLAYSEPLGNFTSFYSYEDTPYFVNLEDKGLWFKPNGEDTKTYLHNEGDYNMFFDTYKPFSIQVIANPNPTTDKIFNNIEFRADSFDKENNLMSDTFDYLQVQNEYQKGETKLYNIINRPSPLKKKFRIWRANIPRDIKNGRDRMRNPWLYIKLAKMGSNKNKTILHDLVVKYFE